MKLNNKSLEDKIFWEKAGIAVPRFDREEMIASTKAAPKWVHFGAGNIFRAFPAAIMQQLLEDKNETTGIIAVKGYGGEIIEKCFTAFDNLTILVTLKSNGTTEKKIIASIASVLSMDTQLAPLKKIFTSPSLQMASFTITEKGYNLRSSGGDFFPDIKEDLKNGPDSPVSYFGQIASLCHERFINGAHPLAMVSMDNLSHNGDFLFAAMETIADIWTKNKICKEGFADYIRDKNKISFPWTMIDKITPRPDDSVRKMLESAGLEEMNEVITSKKTYTAPFVNAEETQYLIIEDAFPNGRPALEKAGVIFTTKEIVDKAEKMKVCTCLNPLHTSLAVFGCLLGYTKISDEMNDKSLVKLIEGVGYEEGLPAAADPGIIKPKDFLDQVIKVRLPNPFMPDTPQRIAADTSLKIPIRFGETIKAYQRMNKNCADLKFIPLVLAGWLRYLLGMDDQGNPFEVSPDPNYEILKSQLDGVKIGVYDASKLKPIISNSAYFGVNLYEAGLGDKVETFFAKMSKSSGAVRKTLKEICI